VNLLLRRRAMLRKDAPLTIILLTVLVSAGSLYLNFLAVIIDALQVGLGFSAFDAAMVGSANLYGGALGSLAAALLNRRINWRIAATIGIIALILFDLTSTLLHGLAPLLIVRFLHGIAGGLVLGAGFIVLSRTANPERTFGIMLMVQVAEAGLGLYVLPGFVDR
jgi:DHA1 family inner membrane transport protein